MDIMTILPNSNWQGIIRAMTKNHEKALRRFLDTATGVFQLSDILSALGKGNHAASERLLEEVVGYITSRALTFQAGDQRWVSRQSFFTPVPFVITPTYLEVLNGILIPGHRCLPFANPSLFQNEYTFFWNGKPVPMTTAEGAPEGFYFFYSIFGEEYAPQYVAQDNDENEAAFVNEPFDDPPEVSIRTLDMRRIYRETSFVPGDRFMVKIVDWSVGSFELKKIGKDEWSEAALDEWVKAAEAGFKASFAKLGPASCIEEQIAHAYWFAPPRMRECPAYSLEEFLFQKTDCIETMPYGIESRFWLSGREIPDCKKLQSDDTFAVLSPVETILRNLNINISEYGIQSYITDSLYQEAGDISLVMERLVPESIELKSYEREVLGLYCETALEEMRSSYNPFLDTSIGPIRTKAVELHTAIIDLAACLCKSAIKPSQLPRHTFIILSQMQQHIADLLEDLHADNHPPEMELEIMDVSLDSMVETYTEIKELIDEALDTFRRNTLTLVRANNASRTSGRLIQISIGGLDIWRRIIIEDTCTLDEVSRIIQAAFGWSDAQSSSFFVEESPDEKFSNATANHTQENLYTAKRTIEMNTRISDLEADDIFEFNYEHGEKWIVRIILVSRHESTKNGQVRCISGDGAAPPEFINGPRRFKWLLIALGNGKAEDRADAQRELGAGFSLTDAFDMRACNKALAKTLHPKTGATNTTDAGNE